MTILTGYCCAENESFRGFIEAYARRQFYKASALAEQIANEVLTIAVERGVIDG